MAALTRSRRDLFIDASLGRRSFALSLSRPVVVESASKIVRGGVVCYDRQQYLVCVGWATFPFRVGFRLFVSPPRRDGSLREGFDVGFPCLSACVLLKLAFLRLAPPPHWRYAAGF